MGRCLAVAESFERAGFHPVLLGRAYDVIERYVEQGRIPGAVVQVGGAERALPPVAFGDASWEPVRRPARVDTIYDCASLTKVVVTTTLALSLVERGRISLDDRVADWVPEFLDLAPQGAAGERPERRVREGIAVRHLLTHTSGMAAWAPLYERAKGPDEILKALCREPLATEPEADVIYSCLGYILLGTLIEREEGATLDRLAEREIFAPLGMSASGFNPDPALLGRIAPTEKEGERVIHGVVHDENARARGGVSGNAGLFSTASDLSRFAQSIMRLRRGRSAGILSSVAVQAATRNYTSGLSEPRGLGWQLRSKTKSSCGDLFGPESFGHTGFTGTSLWIDPDQDLFVVLLTNRVHPTRENAAHLRLRPLFHNAVAAARALSY